METKSELENSELKQGIQAILSFQQQNQLDKAVELSESLLNRFPAHHPLLQNTGLLFLQLKQPQKALHFFTQALRIQSNDALSYNYAGVASCQIGNLDQGIEFYKKALKYNSTFKEAQLNLALALIEKNDTKQAEIYLRRALQAKLESPTLYYNLGYIEHLKKNFEEAIKLYNKALLLEPSYLKCAINLAEALFESDRMQEANNIFLQLIKILPEDKNVNKKLGVTYFKLEKFDQAIAYLNHGFVEDEEDIYIYLASVYAMTKNLEKEFETWQLGFKNFPDNPTMLMSLINLCRTHSMWEHHDYYINELKRLIPDQDYLFKHASFYIFNLSLEEELQFARKIASYYKNKALALQSQCHFKFRREAKSTLKIGYISGCVCNHPEAHMIANMFNTHSRDGFEYYLYATEATDDSDYAKILMTTADHFVDLSGMKAVDAAKKIYQDKIDILVDLTAYHRQSCSEILALRPAPLVIGYLGHAGTRGSDYLEYIITDKIVTLPEDIPYYQEKLIFLPNTHYITNNQQMIEPIDSRKYFGLPKRKFVLTCFNLNMKYGPESFASWMRILKQLPDTVLLLWARGGTDNLKRYAEEQGVDPERLLFAESIKKPHHLARLKILDLFIDSFDCSAHCTAIDTLWAGLPIVTLYGKNVAQRGCSSILKAHGLNELITYSVEEYEAKVIELATQPALLAAVRAKIEANKKTHPLFDTKLFTTHLERAYHQVYDRYLENRSPEHIYIND
jgi:protein O-GlcNAc transferase